MPHDILRLVAEVRPSPAEIGRALKTAYKSAGIRQKDIADATKYDQTTVSSWVNGEFWPPLHVLPIIDELCRQPRGHVLRLAGYVNDGIDVIAAIHQDPHLGEDERGAVILLYNVFLKRSER